MSEADVREAFAQQAAICTAAGASFTGTLCWLLGERLDRSGVLGRRVLDWPGAAAHDGDALPLRLAGGLHALARSGRDPDWRGLYPPAQTPGEAALWAQTARVLVEHEAFLAPWLDGPPQTNEVGRAAGLMSGLLVLADRFGLPFSLYELGASAGLNTVLDRYGYQLGETRVGAADSPVQLAPEWSGASPPAGDVKVVARRGVDRQPLDPADPATRERLNAYVWADQLDRIARLNAALDLAAADPPVIDKGDAADWLETALAVEPEPGVCRVVMHTIAFQYFSADGQARIRAHMDRVGAAATEAAPLAWLAFEADRGGFERRPALTLRVWPGGGERRLATGQPHGAVYAWAGG